MMFQQQHVANVIKCKYIYNTAELKIINIW